MGIRVLSSAQLKVEVRVFRQLDEAERWPEFTAGHGHPLEKVYP